MKKSKRLLTLVLILCFLMCGVFTACKQVLSAPTDLAVDSDNKLTWTGISEARSYEVAITAEGAESSTVKAVRTPYYSLSSLEEGDYTVAVRAVAGSEGFENSPWSTPLEFHRDYENGCTYVLINNSSEYELVADSSKTTGDILVQDSYRGKAVTKISDKAFANNGRITGVTIGKNVKSIGESAFNNCIRLTEISLPDGLEELGMAAFQYCLLLEEAVIPSSVPTLEERTFAYCRALTGVDLGNVQSIEKSAFFNCNLLDNVVIPDTVTYIGENAFGGDENLTTVSIGKGVEEIAVTAFKNCKLLSAVSFASESNLKTIGEEAFSGTVALETIALPNGLLDIGKGAFFGAEKLTNVSLPETVEHIGFGAFEETKLYFDAIEANSDFVYVGNWLVVALNKDEIVSIGTAAGETSLREGTVGLADRVFHNAKNLYYVTLPQTLAYIGDSAFSSCKTLWGVDATSGGLKAIGESAFAHSTLGNIALADGLDRIDPYAFNGCTLITNPVSGNPLVPDTVTSIGAYAFHNTDLWLKDNPADNGVVYAGNWVVGYKGSGGDVTLRENTRGISEYAFSGQESVRSVANIDDVRYIGRGAFYGCKSLASVVLNSNLRRIEDYTFYKCTNLGTVEFPRMLTHIGRSAFYKCTALGAVGLNRTELEEIGPYAFYGDVNVKRVTLNDKVASIGEYAFYNNASLQAIIIPDSVLTIGKRAFSKNVALVSLTLGKGITEIAEYAFHQCNALENLVIPSTVKKIGKYAFYNCKALKTLDLGNVESVGHYAFYNVNSLQSLSLPATLKEVGKYAFKGGSVLKSLLLPATLERVDAHAFFGATSAAIYVECESGEEGWSTNFNSSRRPVVWGCVLSDGDDYIVSFTVDENTFAHVKNRRAT